MCVFCCRGAPAGGNGTLPPGGPKSPKIRLIFENFLNELWDGHRGAQMTPPMTQGTEKDPDKVISGCLRDDF